MRIEVQRSDLRGLMQQVTKVVESRNTIPILAHVRLVNEPSRNGKSRLTATATDLDIQIAGSIEAEGDAAAFCVDAKLLAGIIGKLGGDMITIEHDKDTATVKSGRSRFKLNTLPVDDFPSMEGSKWEATFDADLASLFAPVEFAMSNEATRYYLNGIYLQPTAATATDGHRLSSVAVDRLGEFPAVIIPRKTVGLVPDGTVRVSVSATKIQIEGGGVVLISKLVDGTFPDYERVIPKNNDKVVKVHCAALRDAAARVAIVGGERGHGVRLTIKDNEIALWLRGEGEAEDAVACEYDGDEVQVGFNSQYLADVLAVMPDGEVLLHLADGGAPAVLTSPEMESLRIVLMPMRV